MARWERRIQEVLLKEKEERKTVYELYEKLQREIHGFSPIDVNLLEKKIKDICHSFELGDSKVRKVELKHLIRNKRTDEMPTLTVEIEGSFNGIFIIKTSRGRQSMINGERKEIYYVFSCDCSIRSDTEIRVDDFYKDYEQALINEMIDMALDGKHYVNYDGNFKSYEVWSKYPTAHSDKIVGYTDRRGGCARKMLQNIRKLRKCDDIQKFSEDNLDGQTESYTETWVEYTL